MSLPSLDQFTPPTQVAIRRLVAHGIQNIDLSTRPPKSLAAVLVLVFEDAGQLRVLLTTRSKELRTHAGQTALPGGKMDEEDKDLIHTAYREAHEEVALPLDSSHIHTLCTLEPFISLHKLLVTPVVALLTDNSILLDLRPSEGEVSHIFHHPLEAFLDPSIALTEALSPLGSEDWFYENELHDTTDTVLSILNDAGYRMHRFRSTASPIKGLTSEILILTAEIAFAKCTSYERYADGQLRGFKAIYARLLEQESLATSHS
ncbi:NUDIX hydrolase domain-like protein [Mucidula mucida]|nr:NUDIX hydrolase domain-like protein [Mucidula mucida]